MNELELKLRRQIAALESELSEAISTLSQLATETETEKEPCTHAAYCRDEMIWRKELSEAHAETAAMLEKAADAAYTSVGLGIGREPVADEILALIPTSYAAALEARLAEARLEERERIRQSIIHDQATGAGDYSYAEDYANRIVGE